MANPFTLFFANLVVLFFLGTTLKALNYYVSLDGNDNYDGSSANPWRTIQKVNSMMNNFQPGDQILFRKGDKFLGEVFASKSGNASNHIVFGSYGIGSLPVITGKKAITGWTIHPDNVDIYKASFNDTVSHLYVNGNLMRIARFPNSGWLRVNTGGLNTGFLDLELPGLGYNFSGANCRIRTSNWAYDVKVVSIFSILPIILFTTPATDTIPTNAGYYFDNKLSLLDVEGEWFYDVTTRTVYLWAPGGVHPNTLSVEGVVDNHGIYLADLLHHVTIRDLNIQGYSQKGIELRSGNNITIQNCLINQTNKQGARLNGNNHLIENNTFEDNLNVGIMGNMTNAVVRGNNIRRTGLIPGYGEDGWGYISLYLESCPGTSASSNIIDSTGHTGMRVGNNMIVEKNIINYSCLTLNDGAGIAFDAANGLQINNNIITNSIGSTESNSDPSPYAMGIYFGAGLGLIKNIYITGNTLAFNRYTGIFVNNTLTSDNYQITNNVFYNNYLSQMEVTDYAATIFTAQYNHTFKKNIFYCLNWKQYCLELRTWTSLNLTSSDYGNFDSNYYCNPYNEYVVRRSIIRPIYSSNQYRLNQWKDLGEDLNSRYSQFSFDQFKVVDPIGPNLITNSTFNNLTGWLSFPEGHPVGSRIDNVIHPLLDSCMRIRWNGIGENATISNPFNIAQGNYYKMSFSCAGNNIGEFKVLIQSTLPGVYDVGLLRLCGYENYRKDYSFIFKAHTSDPLAMFTLSMDSPDSLLYIDNVTLHPVNVQRVDSTQLSKLFTNSTNSLQNIPLQGVYYKDLDGNFVPSLTLQPFSSAILIHDNSSSSKVLQLKINTEGFYDPLTNTTSRDTFAVYIRNASPPYSIIDYTKSYLDTTGSGTFNFTNAQNGINYYIEVRHRNSITTWSKPGGEIFSSSFLNYDFTTSGAQAFGNNMILRGSSFCIFSGDVNQDQIVDAGDLSLVDNAAGISVSGYSSEDLNNDQFVDASDLSLCDNNAYHSRSVISP